MKKLIIMSMAGLLYAGDTLIYVGEFDPNGRRVYDAWVVGDTAYLATPSYTGGIIFLDIKDRTHPLEINYFENMGYIKFIEVHDSLAYVTRINPGGLLILNVKDPLNPAIIGSLSLSSNAADLEVIDSLCYVASDTGLYVINVKDPTNPFLITIFSPPIIYEFCEYRYLRLHGDIIFASQLEYIELLHAIDVSNPASPFLLDTIFSPMLFWGDHIYGIDIYSNYAYCGTDTGLWIVDISNPSNLQSVGVISSPTFDVWVMDTFLFSIPGPCVWRLTPDPANPEIIAKEPNMLVLFDIFVDSSYYIYCASRYDAYPWKIYQFKEVGIGEKDLKSQREYLNFKILKNGIRISYNLLSPQYGRIYIIDKSGRILKILREGILKREKILWEPEVSGTYFLILETENKKMRKKIEIVK